jgi:hypothetical protein
MRKKVKSEDSERPVLIARIAELERQVKTLLQPKPQTWDTIHTEVKIIEAPKEPPKPAPVYFECSVCGKRYASDADTSQRFTVWAELVGPNGRPFKNFASEGYLYYGCSLDCSGVISQAIDRLSGSVASKVHARFQDIG